MKYITLSRDEQRDVLAQLKAMPDFLAERFSALSPEAASTPAANGAFGPAEHCWHLADLEVEGFGLRIARLLSEADPSLPDFDGARIAEERAYRTRSLPEAIAAFKFARAANLEIFGRLTEGEWSRAGNQEGVGRVALCDLPHLMVEHDRAHRIEIEAMAPRG